MLIVFNLVVTPILMKHQVCLLYTSIEELTNLEIIKLQDLKHVNCLPDLRKHANLQSLFISDTGKMCIRDSRYASECNVNGRPMLPQTMEFITDMGTIFQSCMKDEISVDAVSYTHLDVYKRQEDKLSSPFMMKYLQINQQSPA